MPHYHSKLSTICHVWNVICLTFYHNLPETKHNFIMPEMGVVIYTKYSLSFNDVIWQETIIQTILRGFNGQIVLGLLSARKLRSSAVSIQFKTSTPAILDILTQVSGRITNVVSSQEKCIQLVSVYLYICI
jgi:hypothetical protein